MKKKNVLTILEKVTLFHSIMVCIKILKYDLNFIKWTNLALFLYFYRHDLF